MSIAITLTDKLRQLPYFADFLEESVAIPDKPFIHHLLGLDEGKELDIESLSDGDLSACIETCVYFGLDSTRFVRQLFWNITENRELFSEWITDEQSLDSRGQYVDLDDGRSWSLGADVPEPLKSELEVKLGPKFDEEKLIELGARFLRPSCDRIARGGNLKLMKWAREKWGVQTEEEHLRDPNAEEKKWNLISGLSSITMMCAARGATSNHLEILKYLREQGCEWDEHACSAAAGRVWLEGLQYLHENGCPWDKWTCTETVREYRTFGAYLVQKYLACLPSSSFG